MLLKSYCLHETVYDSQYGGQSWNRNTTHLACFKNLFLPNFKSGNLHVDNLGEVRCDRCRETWLYDDWSNLYPCRYCRRYQGTIDPIPVFSYVSLTTDGVNGLVRVHSVEVAPTRSERARQEIWARMRRSPAPGQRPIAEQTRVLNAGNDRLALPQSGTQRGFKGFDLP